MFGKHEPLVDFLIVLVCYFFVSTLLCVLLYRQECLTGKYITRTCNSHKTTSGTYSGGVFSMSSRRRSLGASRNLPPPRGRLRDEPKERLGRRVTLVKISMISLSDIKFVS